jgi:hypothetical protein
MKTIFEIVISLLDNLNLNELNRVSAHIHSMCYVTANAAAESTKILLPELNEEEIKFIKENQYVEAIKSYHSRNSCLLSQAKSKVDEYRFNYAKN